MSMGFYRHERAMDVYILALKTQYSNHEYIKLKVEWWARGEYLKVKQTLKIKRSAWRTEWRPCDSNGHVQRGPEHTK